MRSIGFLSKKGGVGKSTTCANVAVALAQLGSRVLVIDLDANASVSLIFGVDVDFEQSIGAALLGQAAAADLVRSTVVQDVALIPGSVNLALIEAQGVMDPAIADGQGQLRDTLLAETLAGFSGEDLILIDCPGSGLLMQRQALLACDAVVIPFGPSVVDLQGAAPTVQLVAMARELRGGLPELIGLLPVRVGRGGLPRKVQALVEAYELPILSPIRDSRALNTAPGEPNLAERLVVVSRPNYPVAESYRAVARLLAEMLQRPATAARSAVAG